MSDLTRLGSAMCWIQWDVFDELLDPIHLGLAMCWPKAKCAWWFTRTNMFGFSCGLNLRQYRFENSSSPSLLGSTTFQTLWVYRSSKTYVRTMSFLLWLLHEWLMLDIIISLYLFRKMSTPPIRLETLLNYISTKMTLDNYDGLINPREHVQNIQSKLELVVNLYVSMVHYLLH